MHKYISSRRIRIRGEHYYLRRNIALAACFTVVGVAWANSADGSSPPETVCVPRGADYHDGAWFVDGRAVILQAAEDDPFTWCAD